MEHLVVTKSGVAPGDASRGAAFLFAPAAGLVATEEGGLLRIRVTRTTPTMAAVVTIVVAVAVVVQ